MANIYRIVDKRTNEEYVGSTKCDTTDKRWAQHRRELAKGTHHNRGLQAAYDRDGLDGLDFEVVEDSVPQRNMIAAERTHTAASNAALNRVVPGTRTYIERDAWGNQVDRRFL